VEGEAGVGKTVLLRAVAERMSQGGLAVLRARGGELERDFGFGVVRQLFEPALSGVPAETRTSVFSGAASLAVGVLGTSELAANRPAADTTFASQHGLYWLAVNLASLRPVVLLVDDAHWSDAASLRWILYLVRRMEEVPLSVALGWRSGEPNAHVQILQALRLEPLVEALSLSGLTAEGTARLVRDRIPDAEEGFCTACHRVTGGNPFLAGELAAALAAGGVRATAENADRVLGMGPPAVSQSVIERLARQPEDAQSLARAVAVLDTDADRRFAAELAGLDQQRLAVGAEALVNARLFEDAETLRFAHPILRAAVYADLAAARRSADHRRAAEVLLASDGDADRAAVHLLATAPAGDAWVARELAQAADRARMRGAADAAVVLLERALDEPPRACERGAMKLARGVAAFMCASAEAETYLREAIGDADDPVIQAQAAMTLSQLEVGAGLPGDALSTLERAIGMLGPTDPDRADRLELYRTTTLAVQGERWQRVQQPLSALHGGASPGSWLRRVAAGCLIWQESLRPQGPRPAALAGLRAELADPAALAQGTGPLDFVYFNWAMMGLEQIDQLATARAGLDAAAAVAHKTGHLAGLAPVFATRAAVLYALGELDGAETDPRQAIHLGPLVGNNVARDWGLSTLCQALADRGEYASAENELAVHRLQQADPGPSGLEARLLIGRAYLRSAQGQHEHACADAISYAARLGDYDGGAFGSLPAICVRILAAGTHTDLAQALSARALEVTAPAGIDGVRGMALHAQGLLEAGPAGIERLDEAVRLLERSPRRLEHARALADLGGALRRANRRADAREPLRSAMDLAERCGAHALTERARQELVATGARPRRVMRSGRDALTASEVRVAELATAGNTITQIAQSLFVTRKTVESHLYSAYRKLGVNTRDELVAAMQAD
jgi:DNA-binding CsgD family transcriptional regulator